jgi:SAM-dependent methyltransferase
MSARRPHEARDWAESFGSDPERYDRARPRYPDVAIRRIAAALPGPEVLDVGCGTGISARQLEAAGCRVLGVEVDPRMAAFARERGLAVEVARFEAWDPAGRTFDGVVAGQSWHWVDPVTGTARAADALRPGGRLALLWNVGQAPPEALATPRAGDPVAGYEAIVARVADSIRASGAFAEPEVRRDRWERSYTRDEWLDELATHGDVGRLPPSEVAAILARVGAALDAAGGGFTMDYTTLTLTARLAAPPPR